MIDDYISDYTTFVSASHNGALDPDHKNRVFWNIGNLAANDPGGCVTLKVRVKKPLPKNVTSILNTSTLKTADEALDTAQKSTERKLNCSLGGIGEILPLLED